MTSSKYVAATAGLLWLSACTQGDTGSLATSSNPPDPIETEVIESNEPALGLDETWITPQRIKAVEQGMRDDAERKLLANAKLEGVKLDNVNIATDSQTLNIDGERAVVLRIVLPRIDGEGPSTLKTIWWIQDQQIKRVFCTVIGVEDFNQRRGKCGKQIEKTFGYHRWALEA